MAVGMDSEGKRFILGKMMCPKLLLICVVPLESLEKRDVSLLMSEQIPEGSEQ